MNIGMTLLIQVNPGYLVTLKHILLHAIDNRVGVVGSERDDRLFYNIFTEHHIVCTFSK